MHKSIIIFFSLLVILLPVGTSNMNISNANAIADFDNKDDKKQRASVHSLNCNNINLNVNGLELSVLPPFLDNSGLAVEAVEGHVDPSSIAGNNEGSTNNDFRFICVNNNNNTVIKGEQEPITPTPPTQTEPPTPPGPPEPTTATLTVKKEIFGCIPQQGSLSMDCSNLQNNSTLWISCDNPDIINTNFCTTLNENSFDIEVLNASNNQQIAQFEGSAVGTPIPNLQPGTYTVNEIELPAGFIRDQFVDSPAENTICAELEFPDGGRFVASTTPRLSYSICFEYEDEQDDDCNTITLAAGEEKTCIVKNHIRLSSPPT